MSLLGDRLDYEVDIETEAAPFLERWGALLDDHSSPFHALPWLRAWYDTLGSRPGVTPLLVGVRRQDTGADVMLLPLVSERRSGISFVSFADAGIVDYISPLLSPDWANGADQNDWTAMDGFAKRLWRAVRRELRGHDVLRIDKMLAKPLDGDLQYVNPLTRALNSRMQDCEMFGNQFHAGEDWDAWRHSLEKHVRKEFERSWRVFTRSDTARFERVTEPAAALELFETLERQQTLRMGTLDYRYVLDGPVFRAFYRQALTGGLLDSSVVLTALRDGKEVVAAQFGVANRQRYVALRLSMGGDEWKACSPGRLLSERTAMHLHSQGVRYFDFGIGDYRHKQMFGVSRIALMDGCEALSFRGMPVVWAWRLRRALKRQPWIVALVRRLHSKRQFKI